MAVAGALSIALRNVEPVTLSKCFELPKHKLKKVNHVLVGTSRYCIAKIHIVEKQLKYVVSESVADRYIKNVPHYVAEKTNLVSIMFETVIINIMNKYSK